jgi:hypothetical protein
MSDNSKLAEADRMKIIDILLDDVEIKEIYLHQDIFSNGSRSQENDREYELLLTRTK